jgi:hypothetical protein
VFSAFLLLYAGKRAQSGTASTEAGGRGTAVDVSRNTEPHAVQDRGDFVYAVSCKTKPLLASTV